MTPLEIIKEKRQHLARLANRNGADGETAALQLVDDWRPRPKGLALANLLNALGETGIHIKASSFDAISVPENIDLSDIAQVRAAIGTMTFIEIKTANQDRVQPCFKGFFFAVTEREIAAADALGTRHRVALFNNKTGELLMTSVPEILARAKSSTWQLSVQL